MAKRRMFSLEIVDTDEFTEMPTSSQCLYFAIGMRSDDDGFCASPKKVAMLCNASMDDLRILIAKGFLIAFESGVVVVRDWKTNNYLRPDRYTPTRYQAEKSTLCLTNGVYGLLDGAKSAEQENSGIPDVNQMVDERYPQYRLGKDRKDNIIYADKPQRTRFIKPSLEEVTAYCKERKNNIDPQAFLDHYESNGWRVGRNAMKNWKAAVRTWERNGVNREKLAEKRCAPAELPSYCPDDFVEYPVGSGHYVLRAEIVQR